MSLDQTIRLHPLTYLREGEGVMIGRFGTDMFAMFPEDGAELLMRIERGSTLSEASVWYEETFGDSVDMGDFLDTLHALQFVREDDSESQDGHVKESIPGQRLGRWLFSPVAWLLYGLLVAVCTVCMIRNPSLRLQNQNLFFSPYLLVMSIVLYVGQFPGLLLHESFHLLAGRRIGLPTRLGVGRRMYFFVFESSLTGVRGLPRRMRVLPIMAGMLADVIWFCLLTLAAACLQQMAGLWSMAGAACLALAYSTMLRFVWQFYFYLQTDIYFLLTNLSGCVHLQQTTKQYLHNAVNRLLGRPDKLFDESTWSVRDRQVARWYVYFYVSGWLWTAGLLVFVGIPVLWRVLMQVSAQITSGVQGASFWDSIGFLAISLGQYLVVFLLYLRERRQKKRQR